LRLTFLPRRAFQHVPPKRRYPLYVVTTQQTTNGTKSPSGKPENIYMSKSVSLRNEKQLHTGKRWQTNEQCVESSQEARQNDDRVVTLNRK
jgi:hypothetical protein